MIPPELERGLRSFIDLDEDREEMLINLTNNTKLVVMPQNFKKLYWIKEIC